ncbi:nicotinate-nucleotide pyrophosphorylase (carboxylating) [Cyanobacterium stanieri PCC 7202]|uniref:Probable nicotinate-nucleotide pyrophosphorylase [carboxylating] n=1 Tax=Cyanobacterium stanieri (strain ATCC 29140 / PCC 7202) TaxID=292563 RepID=K9YLQ5_CYASC|nr:nicotinate-nucleotide pyrophosphorylase (carboxylating) [Cyanobacterium stanieri PCC 7202]
MASLPSKLILEPLLKGWLLEDIGRGDRTTEAIFPLGSSTGKAHWLLKEDGVIAGLPIAKQVFQLLDEKIVFLDKITEGDSCISGTILVEIEGSKDALLTGERVALNLVMHLSGIATMTRKYVEAIADYPTQLVDTRKTTPGLRILEKYATQVGGAVNHRMGLDDAVMIKDNHIEAAGSIARAIALIRDKIPYPLTIEVETNNLAQVQEAIEHQADIIMLDNMAIPTMKEAVKIIQQAHKKIKSEASGNVTLDNIAQIAETGVDFISTSATITRAPWLDLSMKF